MVQANGQFWGENNILWSFIWKANMSGLKIGALFFLSDLKRLIFAILISLKDPFGWWHYIPLRKSSFRNAWILPLPTSLPPLLSLNCRALIEIKASVANRRFNRPFCSKPPLFNSFWPDAFRGLIIYIGVFCPKTAATSKWEVSKHFLGFYASGSSFRLLLSFY